MVEYTDEEFSQFSQVSFKIDDEMRKRLEAFTNFVIGDGTPPHFIEPKGKACLKKN